MKFEEIEDFYKKAKLVKDEIPQIEKKIEENLSILLGNFENKGGNYQEVRNNIVNRVAAVLREEFGALEAEVAETLERVRIDAKKRQSKKK